mgnify:CR=1 FL=1
MAGAVAGMTALYSREKSEERLKQEQEIAMEAETELSDRTAEDETEIREATSVIKPEEVQTTTTVSSGLHFDADTGLMWPMEGNVILDYSMDSTVYFATLDQYKYNPAVIIAGDVNSKVYAVARGKVTGIDNNEETGCTVTVDLGDGYEAVYGQLKELNFSVGDYVEAGHVIGYVSEPTKYYSVEGSNLYFELKKDGQPVDPVTYFE